MTYLPVARMRRENRRRMALGAAGLAVGGYLAWQAVQRRIKRSDLSGKVAVITGGSRGLGLLMARRFAAEGCRIVICARDRQELDAARRTLATDGAEVHTVVCDVGDREQVAHLAEETERVFGGADILVNNASIIQVGPLESLHYQDFVDSMDVNFWGTVHSTLAFLPQLKQRRGRIVNIDSIGGRVAVPHLLPYTCGKFATYGFSEGIRAELAKDHVQVTTVVPGLMRTGSPPNAYYKGDLQKEYAWFSLGGATPLTAMSAERAADRIVRAAKRGESYLTLSWQAKALRMTHDLLPGSTATMFGVANRFFPQADGQNEGRPGRHIATAVSPSPLTRMMDRSAKKTQQFSGRREPSDEHAEQANY